MGMSYNIHSWNRHELLLNINNLSWCFDYLWDFVIDNILLHLIQSQLFLRCNLIRQENLSSVRSLSLYNIRLINRDSEWNFFPLSLLELNLYLVRLFFILCHSNFFCSNIWNFFDYGIVNLLDRLIWYHDVFLVRNFVVNGIGNSLRNNVWDFVDNVVWYFFLS